MKKWIIRDRKDIFNGRVFAIQNLLCHHPEKNVDHGFFVLNTPDWINIIPITEDGRFIMVKQHRLGTDEITIETPAGVVERDEPPEKAAVRELEEETGYTPGAVIPLKKLSANPSILSNYIHFFLATGCRKIKTQKLDLAEDIDVQLYTRDEVISLIRGGGINHSVIIAALSLYFMSRHNDFPDSRIFSE
jgi:8-oxo-dGTP pyrophosphatase MutT (NUDIX family)